MRLYQNGDSFCPKLTNKILWAKASSFKKYLAKSVLVLKIGWESLKTSYPVFLASKKRVKSRRAVKIS